MTVQGLRGTTYLFHLGISPLQHFPSSGFISKKVTKQISSLERYWLIMGSPLPINP